VENVNKTAIVRIT